jgi:hypothetical protein
MTQYTTHDLFVFAEFETLDKSVCVGEVISKEDAIKLANHLFDIPLVSSVSIQSGGGHYTRFSQKTALNEANDILLGVEVEHPVHDFNIKELTTSSTKQEWYRLEATPAIGLLADVNQFYYVNFLEMNRPFDQFIPTTINKLDTNIHVVHVNGNWVVQRTMIINNKIVTAAVGEYEYFTQAVFIAFLLAKKGMFGLDINWEYVGNLLEYKTEEGLPLILWNSYRRTLHTPRETPDNVR